jgi:hypothetical protein
MYLAYCEIKYVIFYGIEENLKIVAPLWKPRPNVVVVCLKLLIRIP